MKKILLAALLAGVATSAFASDLPTRKAPPVPVPAYIPPVFTWTGFYIGVNGGYGVNTGGKDFGNPDGGLVGGTIGYNYQFGQYVLGVEGDWDWADLTSSGTNFVSTYKSNIDDILTARVRAGYAIDRTLLFVTGGYAGLDDKVSLGGIGNNTTWRNGGAIGGGVEYAITNNITAKAEYLFLPMGNEKEFYGAKSDVDLSLFRVGLNYKF